jgi:hypothetical protein
MLLPEVVDESAKGSVEILVQCDLKGQFEATMR